MGVYLKPTGIKISKKCARTMHLIQVLHLGSSTEIMAWYFEDVHLMIFKSLHF